MSAPAYITRMPPSPESSRIIWTMVCPVCGVEEFMADNADDPRLVAHTAAHNASHQEPPTTMSDEQKFRDRITADSKAGNIGIENGWLVEYNEPCKAPCAGIGYGCPPSCTTTPIVDLWRASNTTDVEPECEYGWRLTESDNGDFYDESVSSDETWSTPEVALAQALQAKRDADSEELPPLVVTLLKRTKAGPWEPVPDTNERNET